MGDAQRRRQGRRRRCSPGVAMFDEGSYVKEGVWSVQVQRVGCWAVFYAAHAWRPSVSFVLVEPWDVWGSLSPYDRRTLLMSFLKRRQSEEGSSNGGLPLDPDFSQRFPALFEHMTANRYPDGTARRVCSLTLFSEEGSWKACLNDRDQNLVLFVTEGRFDTLLEALELLLQEELPPWRKSTSGRQKGPPQKR